MAVESMLNLLVKVEREVLPAIVKNPEAWNTLDVLYEPPHVERLWCQQDGYRIYLHRISAGPDDKALYHPHPWPSAVRILRNEYLMGVGYGKGEEPPPVAATMLLSAGSAYEMTDPDGWHYVQPGTKPCLSVMVTGMPWDRPSPGKGIKHPPLDPATTLELLAEFQQFWP